MADRMPDLQQLPPAVQELFAFFSKNGAALYLVGGAVRDLLRGVPPEDYDFSVALAPEALQCLLEDSPYRLEYKGARFGTIGVFIEGRHYEVTSFRREEAYLDARRPSRVRFTASLTEDLARRDFTVNAMAWSPETGLKDPFGGVSDLETGLIRAVGDPRERMAEDALRILRALRFAALQGFELERATACAVKEYAAQLAGISGERIGAELLQLFHCSAAPEVLQRFPNVVVAILAAAGKHVQPPKPTGNVGKLKEACDEIVRAALFFLQIPDFLRVNQGRAPQLKFPAEALADEYRRSEQTDLRILRRLLQNSYRLGEAEDVMLAWAWPRALREAVSLCLADYCIAPAAAGEDRLTAVLYSPQRYRRLLSLHLCLGEDPEKTMLMSPERFETLRKELPPDQEALHLSAETLQACGHVGPAIRQARREALLKAWDLR